MFRKIKETLKMFEKPCGCMVYNMKHRKFLKISKEDFKITNMK